MFNKIEYMKKWRRENKNELNVYNKEYRKQHPEMVREGKRKKYKRHIEYYREYQRNWIEKKYEKEPWLRTYHSIKGRCEYRIWTSYYKRKIKTFLTIDDVKFLWFRDKAYKMKNPSIDRINPYENYFLENCRFIELRTNQKRKRVRKY